MRQCNIRERVYELVKYDHVRATRCYEQRISTRRSLCTVPQKVYTMYVPLVSCPPTIQQVKVYVQLCSALLCIHVDG
jgi:hypothetical protein